MLPLAPKLIEALSPFSHSAFPHSTELTQPLNVSSAASTAKYNVVFIEKNLANWQTLAAGTNADEVVLLDSNADGIAQITSFLEKRCGISAIHIVSHGRSGELQLGKTFLNQETLSRDANLLRRWTNSLTPDANLLLYGCEVGKGEAGQQFVRSLSELTGAGVAASDNLTGSYAKGGDWTLEVNTGKIAADLVFRAETMTAYSDIFAELSALQVTQKLVSVQTVFTALGNTIAQSPSFNQKFSLFSKRFDSSTATVFLNDVSDRVNKTISALTKTPDLNLKIVFDELSKSVNGIGTLTTAIDNKLIASNLLNTIKFGKDTEIVFNFDFSKSFNTAEALSGTTTFDIANNKIQTTVGGNANGLGIFGFKFSLGIDKVGNVFTNEGGSFSSDYNLNTTLSGKATIQGFANAGINGTGILNLDTQLKIDDGDNVANERLYLTGGTLFAPKMASFKGGLKLDQAIIKGNIPNIVEIAIAASGNLNLTTGEAKFTIQQDALLDGLVNAAGKGINSLANQSAKLAQLTQKVPVIGDELSAKLSAIIKKTLDFNAPNSSTKTYLESRGIKIEKIITPDQFFSGKFATSDLLLLRYSSTVKETFQLLNATGNLSAGIANFALNGNLNASSNLMMDLRFGIDLVNGPFLLEGGTINADLPVTGSLNGSATIGSLLKVGVNIPNVALNLKPKLTFSDFDSTADERFYLLGANQISLDALLKNAIALTGSLALDAGIIVADPSKDLNIPLLKDLGLGSFTWNAGVQYDLATGQANYTVRNDARIDAIGNLFQGKQGGIIDQFLKNLIGSNPIPKEIRTLLTEPVPLLGKNLLDIIGAPKGLQLLLNPQTFQGKTLQQINDKSGQQGLDILDLSLDFIKPASILSLLSGQTANLISLDIRQTLASAGKKITVLPDKTIFTFYGLVGVKAGVDIKATIDLLVDTMVGFDTQGFYAIESGSQRDATSRKIGNQLLSLKPTLTGILRGTLDLITVLNLINIAGRISLMGELGLRLDDSPIGVDANPKVRLPELNPNNLRANFGLSLGFGLTSTLFPIGNFGLPLIKEGEVQKTVPLFNKDAGSLADIKNDVTSFVDKTRGEGGLKVFALGFITGDQTLLTAGTALFGTSPPVTQAFRELAAGLKESGRDMLGAARDLARVAQRYGLKLEQTAKFLYENFSGGVTGVARALYREITSDISDVAKGLYSGVTQDLRSLARGLHNGVTTDLGNIAKGLYNGAIRDAGRIAKAIAEEFGTGVEQLADLLWNNSLVVNSRELADALWKSAAATASDIANALKSQLNFATNTIADALSYGAKLSPNQITKALWNPAFVANARELADVLWNKTTAKVDDIANALKSQLSFATNTIADALSYGAGRTVDQITDALWNPAFVADSRQLANILYNYTSASVSDIARSLKSQLNFSTNIIADALDFGANLSFSQITQALFDPAFVANSDELARVLWRSTRATADQIANAFRSININTSLNQVNNIVSGAVRSVGDFIERLVS